MKTAKGCYNPTFSYALIKSSPLFLFCILLIVGGIAIDTYGKYLLLISLIPLFVFVYNFFLFYGYQYELTQEELIFTRGVFSKKRSLLELYRVKDYEEIRPFFHRVLGVMNIELKSSDLSHPTMTIEGIPKSNLLGEIRKLVEQNRRARGVREFD